MKPSPQSILHISITSKNFLSPSLTFVWVCDKNTTKWLCVLHIFSTKGFHLLFKIPKRITHAIGWADFCLPLEFYSGTLTLMLYTFLSFFQVVAGVMHWFFIFCCCYLSLHWLTTMQNLTFPRKAFPDSLDSINFPIICSPDCNFNQDKLYLLPLWILPD